MISKVADEVIAGKLDSEFPLYVWQTGSGHAIKHECQRGDLQPRHPTRWWPTGQQNTHSPQR